MDEKIPDLGPLETQLMHLVWKRAPVTAGEVQETYNRRTGKDLKYTTVMTLLTRMVEKGVLAVDRGRKPFQFFARIGREQMLRQRVDEFVDAFFDGRAVELAVRLVEESELSDESVQRLEEILRRHRERGEE